MKLKLRPIFLDISITFIAEAFILISFFVIYRLIAINFGPEGVGEYSLVKRVIGLLQPVFLLGLGTGLPRYIAMSNSEEQRSSYIKSGILLVIIFSFFFLALINFFKEYFAKIFFSSDYYSNLIFPLTLFSAGMVLTSLVYAYFHGRLLSRFFNLLKIVNLALIPVLVMVFFKNNNIGNFISIVGIITVVTSIIFSLFFLKEFFIKTKNWPIKQSIKELLNYSLPRLVTSFVYIALVSMGPIIAVHFATIEEVGYLSLGQNLLTAMAVVITPVSLVLLPKVSNLIAQKRKEEIKENLNYIIEVVIQCSIFMLVQMLIFADTVVDFWLGPSFIISAPIIRIIFLSTGFYLFCGAVGNVLEASNVKAVNLINACVSLLLFLLSSGILLFSLKIFSPIISLSVAYTIGSSFLGILTYVSIRKIYPNRLNHDLNYLLTAIAINILLGFIALTVKPIVASEFYYFLIFEIFAICFYVLILWRLKANWLIKIPEKILIR